MFIIVNNADIEIVAKRIFPVMFFSLVILLAPKDTAGMSNIIIRLLIIILCRLKLHNIRVNNRAREIKKNRCFCFSDRKMIITSLKLLFVFFDKIFHMVIICFLGF